MMMNLDIKNERLILPVALFILLSPGLLLSLPTLKIASMETTTTAIVIHSLVLVLVYWLIAKFFIKKNLTKADLIVPAVLFLILSPHGSTSPQKIGMMSLIFFVVYAILRATFPDFY